MPIVNKIPANCVIYDKWITVEPVYDVKIEPTRVVITSKNPDDPRDLIIIREYNDPDQSITTGTIAVPVQQLPKSVQVGDALIIHTPIILIREYEDLADPWGWGTLIAEINGVPLDPTLQIKINNDPGVPA